MSNLYLIDTRCPHCSENVKLVEETDVPIALDQDIPLSTGKYCPECGEAVGEWDIREEHEIERIYPSNE